MTKKYLLEQIKRVENIIEDSDNRMSYKGVKFECFGLRKTITGFSKNELYNYLEKLVDFAYKLNLLDNTFTY